jgi:hypothetical protein
LFRYADKQAFRYNNRKSMSDADRFSFLVRKVVGKRLTYAELTDKTEEGTSSEEGNLLTSGRLVALSARLDPWLWSPPIWIQRGLPFVLRFASHDLPMWNGQNLAYKGVEAMERFWAFDAFRQRRLGISFHVALLQS